MYLPALESEWKEDNKSAPPLILVVFFFNIFFLRFNFLISIPVVEDIRRSGDKCNLSCTEFVSNMLQMKNDL